MKSAVRIFVISTLILIALVGLLTFSRVFDAQQLLKAGFNWISSIGLWGGVVFIGLYALCTVLFLPGLVLTLMAGAFFGLVWGFVVVSIGSITGATLAFLIGRYLARDWVVKRITNYEKFKAIDKAIAKEGWNITFLLRLSPVFPFNLLNYALGVTEISFKDYFLASWIGMIPATVIYVYVGALTGDLAKINVEGQPRMPIEWILYCIGLIATIALVIYITRIARKALQEKVHQGNNFV